MSLLRLKGSRKDRRSSQYGSIRNPSILIILVSCFLVLVVLLAWFALDRIKEKIQADVGDALQIVLQTTQESLNLWAKSNKFHLNRLARDPRLVSLTEKQLLVPRNKISLTESEILKQLRAFFWRHKNEFRQSGFFIIAPDFVSIASQRDSNIGTKNLVAVQALDLLNRAFQGETVMVPPIWSDVTLSSSSEGELKRITTMFFAAPIKNIQGKIIAVVTQRVDPSMDFSRLIQLGRIGKSGETYAFSRYGKLLSESRFDKDLHKAGLIDENEKSILSISVRNPGGDMTKGFSPSIPRYQQPLTLMAQEATRGKSGLNVKGYRDYRGVPVYGAWLWDDNLDIGLTTEIDKADALSPYYTTRIVILTVMGITVLLALSSLLFAVVIEERAGRALQKSHDELEIRVQERTAELRKLSQATENSPASVVVTDKNGTIEYVNPTFSEVTGYSAEEAIGQNPKVLKSGDLPESFYKELWDTILSGKVWRGEFINKRKNGEEFWESASISPIMDEAGEITHFVAVKQDTTERKAAEEALRASEEKSRLLLESVAEGIFGVDLDGKVAFINPAANRMLGFGPEDLIGSDVHEQIHHSHADGSAYPKIECPMYLTHAVGTDHHIADEVLWRKDGTQFPVEYTSMPIKKNGQVVGAVVTFMDITDRKKMEVALRENQKRVMQAAEISMFGFWELDMNSQEYAMTDSLWKLFGTTAEKEGGYAITEQELMERFIPPEDVHLHVAHLQAALIAKDSKPRSMETHFIKANGEMRYGRAQYQIVFDQEGKPMKAFGSFHDFTERKQIEEDLHARVRELDEAQSTMQNMMEDMDEEKQKAEAATRAKSDFLANMSHEIRTPMNAVIGMAHLALKTALTPKQQDYLNKIQSSANSLLGIINDILDFSKIEAGKLDMEAVEFDLSETLDNVANVITVKAEEKENLEVLFYLDSRMPNFLVGDSLRLNQILVNLGNNAVKFTEQGEIVLTTKLIDKSEDKVTLQFSMRDTGIGMTAEQQARLFQAFSQADTSTTRKFGGTGLGLTISKRLVNMMDGEIWVESEPGKGTTFSFTADFGLGKETVKKRFVPSSDLKGLRVLVVDDNVTSRQIFQDILESFSCEVHLAASGEDALEEIERADEDQPFELVIMDWKMPGMDGIEASGRIKTNDGLHKIPAIVLVTAYGREELMQRADEIGLEGFLLKPVSSSMLFDAIMQALGKEIKDVSRAGRKKDKDFEDWKAIQGARVLLVEDNEINQQVAKEILESAGLNVALAADGQEGVNAVKENNYDVVLMDVQMPVMDGYTATKAIRKWEVRLRNKNGKNSDLKSQIRDPKSKIKNVPIIAMTAHAMAGDEDKSLEAGMNDHVTKPIDPDQLFAILQKWIKPKEKRTAIQEPAVSVETSTEDEAISADGMLPESLPGFDLAAGLERLRGNKSLYRKLLLDFGADYGGVAGEIREALATQDFKQAHSLVHNLKGLAGNLEATDLQIAAVELEKLVKGQTAETASDKKLYQKLTNLESALNQALGAVQSLGPVAEKKTIASSKDVKVSVPPEQLKKVTESIKDAIEMGDVTQIKSIAAKLLAESDALAPFCDELIQLADDFDFDGIQKLVHELDG